MRKIVTVILSAALVVGAFGAPAADAAKKKKARKASAQYEGPAIGASGNGICFPGTLGCFSFGTARGENHVSVEVVDTLGTPVHASVTQDLDGDGFADASVDICGTSEEPIPIESGYEVTIFIWEGVNPAPLCPSVATNGTINVTFTP